MCLCVCVFMRFVTCVRVFSYYVILNILFIRRKSCMYIDNILQL